MNKIKFPYGDQFDIDKFKLNEILNLCANNPGNKEGILNEISKKYWTSSPKPDLMSKNTLHTLIDYKLIDDTNFELTPIAETILQKSTEDEMNELFAKHILNNVDGISFIKLLDKMYLCGDDLNNENIIFNLNQLGYEISPSSTYINTMKNWLYKGGIFTDKKRWESIDWDKVENLLGGEKDILDGLTTLTSIQNYFLRSLYDIDAKSFILSNQVRNHAESTYNTIFPHKSFSSKVIKPLENLGYIEVNKTSNGGSDKVKLSKKLYNELSKQYLEQTSKLTNVKPSLLKKSFDEVCTELYSSDTFIKGQALELFSIYLLRYVNLKFDSWRLRSKDTGYAEIDLIASQTTLGFHRWQIQCKNCAKVELEVIAKEVGHTYLTKADTLLFIATGKFTDDALKYAYTIMKETHLTIFFINSTDIIKLKDDPSSIIDIFKSQTKITSRLKSFNN